MTPRKPSVEELFHSFPSLSHAAGVFVADSTTFESAENLLEWAGFARARLNEEGLQAAYFVATVINDFEKLPKGVKFDFASAIINWDEQHWAAFRDWACQCLVNNPSVRLEFTTRRLDPDS